MIRVGVVGLGRFGRLHALTLARLGEARLAALVARRAESIARVQAELPGVPGWTDLDAAIEASQAEAWVVACSTSQHTAVARKLLAAGKTVLLEKPISDSLADAESLRPWVRDDSSNLMLGHIVLFNSEFRALREEAAKRGTPSYIDCVRHRPATIVHDFPGENPLHAAMVHDLYMIQALMGGAEPRSFAARYHRTPSGAIDLAVAHLQWPADLGTVASLAASYLSPAGMPPRGFDRLELFGPGWAARMAPNPRPLTIWDDRARWPLALEILADASGVAGMMAEELRHFCRVAGGLEPVAAGASYFDGLQVQGWMEQLARAADESDQSFF